MKALSARSSGDARLAAVLGVTALAAAGPAEAYIGPGAGFALGAPVAFLFVTIVLVAVTILIWPFRKVWRMLRRRRPGKPVIKRLVVVGLDGQDPRVTDRLLEEGKLPNLAKLAGEGSYHRLETTYPSITPVAWSSFSTGVQPGKHNIFDFLDRDRRSYLPILSSVRIGKVDRVLKLGKFRIPLGKPELTLLRRSKPFWKILGEANVWSTVIRVPISFPPDKFYGAQLGAMSIPDLLGTQGTFLLYTTRKSEGRFKEGGIRVALEANGTPDSFDTVLHGPENSFLEDSPPLEIPLSIRLDRAGDVARVKLNGDLLELTPGRLSDWVKLTFPAAPGVKVSGLCRMMVTEMDEEFSLYLTPISIDPESPAMPISHPSYYSAYLAKRVGPYSTMGLAEDTWALNEQVTNDETFWTQTVAIDDERREMFFSAMDRQRSGALVCVFDGIDRVQHMYWRYAEDGHPAQAHSENGEHVKAIEAFYRRNDELVGEVREKLRAGDLLMVISDHGFTSFRRGVNLNRWFLDNGYLALKEGTDGSSEWLRDVDWSRTRAYAVGLSGIFLNIEGREAEGIVKPGEEAEALKAEIMEKLEGLRDEEKNAIGINEAFDSAKIYDGPYKGNAPDLLIGYNHGYRASWDCASGVVACPVFEDNIKAWSGDHCVDPRLVPGVFFCNRAIDTADPALIDIAPTALELFGLKPPAHMEGKQLFDKASFGEGEEMIRAVILTLAVLVAMGSAATGADAKRVVVLGFDGLDPAIVRGMMDEGRLPNMLRLSKEGGFSELGTSIPPQSPVAWSNFITGMDAGGHGIFDFMHRDPNTVFPFLSTSETTEADGEPRKLFGKWQLPPGGGEHVLLRHGTPFWETLEENGVPTMIIRMPANFPVSEKATYEISGMGTPDVRGTYGTFSFYTTDASEFAGKTVGGGAVYNVTLRNGSFTSKLEGPYNPFVVKEEKERSAAEFTVNVDPEEPYALLEIEGHEYLLREGEWTEWVPVNLSFMGSLSFLPGGTVPVMTRFYLKQAHPELKLFATPLDYDPMSPAIPMSHPPSFAKEMAEGVGRFFTEGMPEDTKALDEGVLTVDEFLSQAKLAGDEIIDEYPWVLDRFEKEFGDHGFLFYYTGNHDQIGHMLYRTIDPGHPAYDPAVHAKYADVMPSIIERLDEMVGYTLDRLGDTATVIVMSDHGFASWRRAMSLNSWLHQEGYLALKNPNIAKDPGFFLNVDWSKTRAYGLGLNGLYVNLRGRERRGIVAPSDRRGLLEEIAYELVKATDPETGLRAVTKAYISEDAYHDRGYLDVGPDMIVGYAREMRGSNQSAMGEVPEEIFSDNDAEWSADHCMDHTTVPGVLFSNRPLRKPAPTLQSLAASILAEFEITGFPGDVENLKAVGYIAAKE